MTTTPTLRRPPGGLRSTVQVLHRRLTRLPLLCLLAASSSPMAQSLKPGDLAFTTFNADQDGWALVALVDLAPGTQVFFTDNPWSSTGGFAAGGGFERWVSGGSTVTAGTVLQFNYIDDAWKLQASRGTLTRETVAGSSSLNLSQTAGTLYAYQGSNALTPSVFITAISNGDFSPAVGSLAGTGLTAGGDAVQLAAGADFAEFSAARNVALSVDQYRSLISNSSGNWTSSDAGQYAQQLSNAAPLASLVVPEPGGLLLLLAGGLSLAGARRAVRCPASLSRCGMSRSACQTQGPAAAAAGPLQHKSRDLNAPQRASLATPPDRGGLESVRAMPPGNDSLGCHVRQRN
jgi:hypothetical protein